MTQVSIPLPPANSPAHDGELKVFSKVTLRHGRPASLKCVELEGQTFGIRGRTPSIISLEDEWYEDVRTPETVINRLRQSSSAPADIFTFWQRLPDSEPQYDYPFERESIAALRVTTFDNWFNKQVKGTTRNMIRKSQKAGVQTRECTFDDEFVRGMTEIFNEAPVRQGRPFYHYGKDFETVKRQFSRYLFRETLIGAYREGKLVGFVMLGNAGKYAVLGQFISLMCERDRAINNALIAETVKSCEKLGLPYLVYGSWEATSLTGFKSYSGFTEVRLPRYFVPLTCKGRLTLKLGLHRGWGRVVPDSVKEPLKGFRSRVLGWMNK